MNKTVGIQLLICGLVLAGLSYLTHHLAPTLAQPTLIAGLAGGALCLIWGVRVVMGNRGKALPILTLAALSYVLLTQMIMVWTGGSSEVPGRRPAAAVITVMFVLCMALLMRVGYAGLVFGGQSASPTKDTAAKAQASGKTATQANADKRA